MHRPGIEPGSTAWKAAMLATIPPMHTKAFLLANDGKADSQNSVCVIGKVIEMDLVGIGHDKY